MSLLELCEKYFGSKDLYDVLGISKSASAKEVRKAYHRMSLRVHPDRVDEAQKAEATEKFKVLGKLHSILSDKEKRRLYDDTGDLSECDETRDWSEYWTIIFQKITIEDINNYEKKYKGSEEERSDLKRAYLNGKGDMDFIYEAVPFSSTDEEPRLRGILQELIDAGEVPAYRVFTHEPARKKERRKRKMEKEAREAAEMSRDLGLGERDTDLQAMIQTRHSQRAAEMDSFLDALAAKYAAPKGKAAPRGKVTPDKRGRRSK
ncbi:dnaJ homolog subfamily C member 9 [Bacillus rossius redtenbacheri]|uniref:dnaJ homolog subfamily C member 9 n=1 Tax=Bacillus rossius redtenbacheri TaxID=93214 RepID=UPI002FDCBE50